MIITLNHIANAIRKNFVMAKEPAVPLEVATEMTNNNKSIGRMVFVGSAVQRGYSSEAICAFLDMSAKDFHAKLSTYKKMLASAREKEMRMRRNKLSMVMAIDKDDSDRDLRLLRKVRLIENCLNLELVELSRIRANNMD